jgi:GntR family transcriptional regulator
MLGDRMISASRFSNRPLYLQLRDALAERIAGGEWKPTTAIPNESDLAREFGVSAGTMRKALDLMEAERLLTRRQGRGTFVNDQSSDELAARFSNIRGADGKRVCGQVKSSEVVEGLASETECARLRLSPDDPVYRIHRVRHHKGQVFLVEDVTLPAALFPCLEDKKPAVTDRVIVLAQEYGILLGKAEERVSLSGASPTVAQKLGVAPGTPVMVLDRVVLALDGRPIEWRMGWCHLADRYYMAEMV